MEKAIEYLTFSWKGYYFLTPIVILCSFYSAIVFRRCDPRLRFRKLFLYYNVAVFLLFLNTDLVYAIYGKSFDELKLNREIELLNLAFNILEMHVFFSVLRYLLHDRKVKAYINKTFFTTSFLLVGMYVRGVQLNTYSESNQIAEYSALIHFLAVIPFITLYFYTIYRGNKPLSKSYILIIFSTFSYCIISTIVFSVSCIFINHYVQFRRLYTLHYCFLLMQLLTILSLGLKNKKRGHLLRALS
jgi:hypothetical protein